MMPAAEAAIDAMSGAEVLHQSDDSDSDLCRDIGARLWMVGGV